MLFIHGLGARVRAAETTDLAEGGVVTEKPTTPEDTRNTTHNTTDKPLHSILIGPWPAAAGAACSCTAMWCETTRLYFSHTSPTRAPSQVSRTGRRFRLPAMPVVQVRLPAMPVVRARSTKTWRTATKQRLLVPSLLKRPLIARTSTHRRRTSCSRRGSRTRTSLLSRRHSMRNCVQHATLSSGLLSKWRTY